MQCVVAFPTLSLPDRAWIDGLRAQYDPRVNMIDPHWTMIFPVGGLDGALLVRHVAHTASQSAPITFEIRCVLAVRDVLTPLTHLFLVPDTGFSHIVRLHDALYTGPLAPHLLLEVPYVPHITIGAFTDASTAKAVADTLNKPSFTVRGTISALSILTVRSDQVICDGTIPLGNP